MELSPLRAHKFRFGFIDTSDSFCEVCLKTKKLKIKENNEHYLLHCDSYVLSRNTLFQKISDKMELDFSTLPKKKMVSILLYGTEGSTDKQNNLILNFVAEFIEKSKRLDIKMHH